MGPVESKSKLCQSIAEILGTAEPANNTAMHPGPFRRSLIYSSMALLAINPVAVNAVGLGEISVNSHLGQPLDATVPFTLAAGESIPQDCIAPARASSAIGTPKKLRVSSPAATQPGTYNLRVSTTNALHEPMYEISLLIDCPGTSVLLRQYVLMLDMPGITAATPVTSRIETINETLTVPATTAQKSPQPAIQATALATNQSNERSLQSSGAPIAAGKSYRVSKGDTLSTIAARIDGRSPDTTWSVANLIFLTNSHAFIRNNPNLIKLGSKIDIPDVAELSGLEKDRMPIASATRSEPSESFTVPRPTPVPAPVTAPVVMNRPEVSVAEPKPKQPVSTTLANETAVITPFVDEQPTPSSESDIPESESVVPESEAVITPFLDEQPALPNEGNMPESGSIAPESMTVTPESADQPIPVVTTTTQSEPSDSINPLLAILVGMLLGVFLSFMMLRRKLIDAVLGMVRRRTPVYAKRAQVQIPPSPRDNEETANDVNTFDTSEAKAAFAISQEDTEALPIGDPAENTYIVETSEAAPTEQIEPLVIDPGMVNKTGEIATSPDDEVLAMLFDDSSQTSDGLNSEIFDPTGSADTDAVSVFSEPTVEMPEWEDEQIIDPALDPEIDLPAECDEELLLDETAQMPDAASLEGDLNALASDEEELSDTLQEAMSLLEGDFDDEFTASQVIERAKAARTLEETETEEINSLDQPEQKASN